MRRPFRVVSLLFVGIVGLTWMAGRRLHAEQQAGSALAAQPVLWVTPLELDFGPVGVGVTSATHTVTISNEGTATLGSFAGGAPGNPQFSAAQNCAGGVAPGGSCQYFFTFTPNATGSYTTRSSTSTNAGRFTIILHGEGVGPGLVVSPFSLDFGDVFSGTTSLTQKVTIRNTGLSTLTNFAGGGVNAPFSAAQNCAGGVPAGGSCQYFFTFAPTSTGTSTATSSSSTNAGHFAVDMRGRGYGLIFAGGQRVTPRGIDFGPVGVGQSSGQVGVTITNQSLFFTISQWAGGGVNAPFSAAQNCAGGVAPGDDCQFFYSFSPTDAGSFETDSNVSNSFGTFTISLRGTGVGPSQTASPLTLDFGPVPLNTTSPTQKVAIRNTGPVALTGWAGGGVSSPFSAAQNCAGGVAPGGSCQFIYSFTPTAKGRFATTSNFSTNAGPISIRLLGGPMPHIYLPLISR